VVRDPERRRAFRAAVTGESTLPFVRERGQRRPADWPDAAPAPVATPTGAGWVRLAAVADVPHDGGITVRHGAAQIAVFHFASRDEWYATQAVCPHRKDAVLGRGLLGTDDGTPKVACPMHKKTFALTTGAGLSDPTHCIRTYPVEIRDGEVWVDLAPRAAAVVEEARA
jgi:nitrite reductase (NADH) large subunit